MTSAGETRPGGAASRGATASGPSPAPPPDPEPSLADTFRHRPKAPGAPLRTFHPRRSPLGATRRDALERLWPRYGFSVHEVADAGPGDGRGRGPGRAGVGGGGPAGAGNRQQRGGRNPGVETSPVAGPRLPLTPDGLLDAVALFGRTAPLVLEIGSGMGEATAAMAAADPGRDYLAVEAHLPGIANLLALLEAGGVENVRIGHGDALELVADRVAPGSLDAVHVFFPDPWPKARHHKRRLVSPERVTLLASRLRPGGVLHCATDWADYGEQMLEVLTAEPLLENATPGGGYAPRPVRRPVTKFERRGLAAGHEVVDLVFRRR